MTPVVSVCIPNYNGENLIRECIDSVLAQVDAPSVEIIVHDDASSDRSVSILRQHFPNIRLIESTQNVGFCVANNRMAEVATGEYLLLLNNDAELLPDALKTLYDRTTTNGDKGILSLPQYERESRRLVDRGCLLDPFFNPVPNLDQDREEVAMTIGACLWISRQLWVELGGFPEWFGSIAEDLYLCCLARLGGHTISVTDQSGYLHRIGQSFGGGKAHSGKLSTTYRRRTLSERNKSYTMLVTVPYPVLVLLFPLHLGALILEGLVLTIVHLDTTAWRKIYWGLLKDLWFQRKRLMNSRRLAQARRVIDIHNFYSAFVWRPYKLSMLLKHGLPRLQ